MGELYAFKQDKNKYESQIGIEENVFNKQKLMKEYQDKTKRYLGTAISIINKNFNINYSMNKEAVGMTATFQKINTIVRKTDQEISIEMEQLSNQIPNLAVSDDIKETIELAIEIVTIYCTNGVENSAVASTADINVFEDNKVINETRLNQNSESVTEKQDSNIVQEINEKVPPLKKDSPFISYKVKLGLLIIPVVSLFMTFVLFIILKVLSKLPFFSNIIGSGTSSMLYVIFFYGLLFLFSWLVTSFISSFISGRTNNKISFMILPFSLLILLIIVSKIVIDYVTVKQLLDVVSLLYINVYYACAIIILYTFMPLFYILSVFQKHTKTSIVEFIDISIIIYVGILPGIKHILEVLKIDQFKGVFNALYNYPKQKIVFIILIIICILSNIIYSFIKYKKGSKSSENIESSEA